MKFFLVIDQVLAKLGQKENLGQLRGHSGMWRALQRKDAIEWWAGRARGHASWVTEEGTLVVENTVAANQISFPVF